MELQLFLPFVLFSFFASVTPGPANLAIFSQSCNSKWNQIFLFGLGITIGFAFVLFTGAVIYLSGSSTSFYMNNFLKWVGSCYFLYLGVKIFQSKVNSIGDDNHLKSFIKGLLVHPLSYKAWLFVVLAYTSFIPVGLQSNIIYFGFIFLISSVLSMIPWVIGRYFVGKKMKLSYLNIINRISGITLISLVVSIWVI